MITFIEHPLVSEKCDHYEIMVNGKKANAVKTVFRQCRLIALGRENKGRLNKRKLRPIFRFLQTNKALNLP